MSAPKKPSAAEVLAKLLDMADDDAAEREMDRILALTPGEVDRELEAHGIDPAKVRARGELWAREAARLLLEAADCSPPPDVTTDATSRPGSPTNTRR